MHTGRKVLYTDEKEITASNVVQILRDILPDFESNVNDCIELLAIEAGIVSIDREKKQRADIDVKTVDNVAHEISLFKEGFHWGNPIAFVQRGVGDSGNKSEHEAIDLLNECYCAEDIGKKQAELGHYVEICGIGYTYVDIKTDYVDGDSYFTLETLSPMDCGVVRSTAYTDKRIIMGFAVHVSKDLTTKSYTVFTRNQRFEIINNIIANGKPINEWNQLERSGERNPLGMIPIIEYERAADRMGVFEREIPEIKRVCLILCDIGNDIDQETQTIWHTNDVDFKEEVDSEGKPTGEVQTPKSNDWVQTYTSRDGKTPFIKPLTSGYNYQGLLDNYIQARTLILQRTFTPQRNDNSGGSTGVAMSDATGWSAAEQVACLQQEYTESAKMKEVRVVIEAIKKNYHVKADSPLLKLRYIDVKPNITRTRSYEMAVKTSAFANLISHGIYGLHAIKYCNMFDDPNQVWDDSKKLIEEFQKTSFGEKEEVQQTSDNPNFQIGNSPNLDGMSKETPEDAEDVGNKKEEKKEEKGDEE